MMETMAAAAAAAAPRLRWPTVADQYRRLAGQLITTSAAA
jgi:hypothetical protein